MRRSIAFALAALVLSSAAAAAQPVLRVDTAAVTHGDAELTALRAEYAAAASAGDARRLSALYAPDAIAVLKDGLMLRGSAQIHQYAASAFASAAPRATVTLVPQQLRTAGAIASETGTFSETAAGEGTPAASGVYVAIYTRRGDGIWRIAMEVRARGRSAPAVSW